MLRTFLVLAALCMLPGQIILAQSAVIDHPPEARSVKCSVLWGTGIDDGIIRKFCCAHERASVAYDCALKALIDARHTHLPGMDQSYDPCNQKFCPYAPDPVVLRRSSRDSSSTSEPRYKVQLGCVGANGQAFCIEGKGDTFCEAFNDAKESAILYATATGMGGLCSYRVCKIIVTPCCQPTCCTVKKRCRLFR